VDETIEELRPNHEDNQQDEIERLMFDVYGVKDGNPFRRLPDPVLFKKDPKSQIPQLTMDFFSTYSEKIYTMYYGEMTNTTQPNSLSFVKRDAV